MSTEQKTYAWFKPDIAHAASIYADKVLMGYVAAKRLQKGNLSTQAQTGFTLIEMLIVIVVLGILAIIIVPAISVTRTDAQAASALRIVRLVQNKINHHHAKNGSWPADIPIEWFASGRHPRNPFDPNFENKYPSRKLIHVHPPHPTWKYPGYKTFDRFDPYWYNPGTGAFRVRVPYQGTDAATLALFNRANGTKCTSYGQRVD